MDLFDGVLRAIRGTRKRNSKLGTVYSWSLPPLETCPGATAVCQRQCYAKKARRHPSAWNRWQRNFELSRSRRFIEVLPRVLRQLPECLLRLHVSGDFYSVPYTRSWIWAAGENPHIHLWTYTRSWRVPRILRVFGSPPPGWIMASVDRETGLAPPGFRVAYMYEDKFVSSRDLCRHQSRGVQCAGCGLCGGWRCTTSGQYSAVRPAERVDFAGH